ncbi:hypothetical protein D9M68_452200 [compost metagenome]
MDEAADDGVVAEPAAGFRFPGAEALQRAVAEHPGLAGEQGFPAEDQVRQGASAQVAGAHALAAVAAGQGDAVLAVHQHVRAEAPRHAQVAAPAVGDAHIAQLREELAQQVAAQVEFVLGEAEVLAQPAAEAVAAPRAEGQAVVGGALCISHLAAALAEGLAVFQADLRPLRVGERFGSDQQALHRQLVLAQRRQAGGVAFDGRHHPVRPEFALGGAYQPRLPVAGGALLEQLHAHALHRPRQSADQPGRLDGGAVRRVDAAVGVGYAQLAVQFLGAQPAVVGFAQAFGIQLGQLLAQALFLLRVACGAIEDAALAVVAVDAFALQHLGHFVRDAMEQVEGGLAHFAGQRRQGTVLAQQVAHQPAAVAAAGAKAGELRLDDGDLQLRGLALEVIGRPQPGVAGADDRHVHLQRAGQRRSWPDVFIECVHPQADRAPVRHGGFPLAGCRGWQG